MMDSQPRLALGRLLARSFGAGIVRIPWRRALGTSDRRLYFSHVAPSRLRIPRPQPPIRPRLAITFVALAAVGAVVAVLLLRRADGTVTAQPAYETVAVERRSIRATVSAVGSVEFGVSGNFGFRQSGQIAKLAVAVGDVVAKGAVLAVLDTRDLERSLADARSAIRQAELQLLLARQPADPLAIELLKLDVADAQASLQDLQKGPSAADVAGRDASIVSAEAAIARATREVQKLQEAPTPAELADALSSIASGRASVVRAEDALRTLADGPTATELQTARDEVSAAQAAIMQAEKALADAKADPAATIADAESSVRSAEADALTLRLALADLQAKPTPDQIARAQDALERARLTYNDVVRTGNPASAETKARAEVEYREAQRAYNEAVQPATEQKLADARARLAAAEARLAAAQRRLEDARRPADLETLQLNLASAKRRLSSANLRLAELAKPLKPEEIAREEQNIAAARASLNAAYARYADLVKPADAEDVRIAKESLRSAEASLAEARARWASLDAGPEALALARAEAAVSRARIKLQQLQAAPDPIELERLELAVADAQRRVEAAQATLDDATLRAPFAGVITATTASEGAQASANILSMVRLDSIRARSNIDEADIGQIQAGQTAQLTFEALRDARYAAKVSLIAPQGVTQQGITSFPVWFQLERPDRRLLGGLTASIEIVVAQADSALVVPRRAVRTQARRQFVEVLDAAGALATRPVVTGVRNDDLIEIKQGVAEGESVVVRNATSQLRTVNPLQGGGGPAGGGFAVRAGAIPGGAIPRVAP